GEGRAEDLTSATLAEMMVGTVQIPQARMGRPAHAGGATEPRLVVRDLVVEDDAGRPAVRGLTLAVRPGEILGIAGVSGNGQRELVEALIGQRRPLRGEIRVGGQPYRATRGEIRAHRARSLPEEPLRNAFAAVLLVSEDLDELLELSDRLAVIFEGRLVHETLAARADIAVIGPCMAGHHGAASAA